MSFLLANDFDNSNPAVQAEQLNWLHFMMNFGSIVANDPTANFDGVRVDAVDNVNADLLQIRIWLLQVSLQGGRKWRRSHQAFVYLGSLVW